jgi:hypothetical protein
VQVRRTRLKEEPSLRARPKAAPPRWLRRLVRGSLFDTFRYFQDIDA